MLAVNKTPGLRKIPIELYTDCWCDIADDLVEIYYDVLQIGSLFTLQRKAIIIIIPKKQ